MNSIALTGRTTKEPELRQTQSGKDVCSFTLAVDRPGVRDTTDFIPCVAWEQSARYLATYGGKGRMVAVTGKLTQRDWEDKNSQRRTTYEVLCDRVELIDSKPRQTADVAVSDEELERYDPRNRQKKKSEQVWEDITALTSEEDLPF